MALMEPNDSSHSRKSRVVKRNEGKGWEAKRETWQSKADFNGLQSDIYQPTSLMATHLLAKKG